MVIDTVKIINHPNFQISRFEIDNLMRLNIMFLHINRYY